MLLLAVILPLWLVFILLVWGFTWIKINVSPSVPYGLYSIADVTPPVTLGMLVVVEVPGWSPPHTPFLKPVAAVGGDRVCRVQGRLRIRDEDYGVVHTQWKGVALPTVVIEGHCRTVPEGYVFLATTTPNSLDSRYYGVVAVNQITATATPLLTFGASHAAAHPSEHMRIDQ
jgi:type IV secretory pathway protease TraF